MFFTPEHISEIISGAKTQTRRIVKPSETEGYDGYVQNINEVYTRYMQKPKTLDTPIEAYRLKWMVGRDYAVTPGVGKPGVWWHPVDKAVTWHIIRNDSDRRYGWEPLRIRLLAIRQEALQNISLEDCAAEGIRPYTFAKGMMSDTPPDPRWAYMTLWDSINTRKGTRWDDDPQVWVLTFEVVR